MLQSDALIMSVFKIITSDGPTNQLKKGAVSAALNSAAHLVGGNNFLNCTHSNKLFSHT